jgi:glycosyltransferase involved in cell wall biosynthesis
MSLGTGVVPERPRRFTILSTCGEPWGGSEELWWAAACELVVGGHSVEVLKTVVPRHHPRVHHLRRAGCPVRDLDHTLVRRAGLVASAVLPLRAGLDSERCRMLRAAFLLCTRRPDLLVISQGQNFEGTHFARVARALRLPYILIAHKASDLVWPIDEVRDYHARAYEHARLSLFVAERNRRLTEEQLGARVERSRIVRNPVLAGTNGPVAWPARSGELRMACVARLDILEKGQDVLLRVLANERWRARPVSLRIYGAGHHARALIDLARSLDLHSVSFPGTADDIERVWANHHVLVLGSRAEGIPLALVEAMMCGRPAVVTDVGGCREFVEDGVSGFVAFEPTVGAVDAALEQFWARRDDWEAMGARASAQARRLVPVDPGRTLAELMLTEALAEPART